VFGPVYPIFDEELVIDKDLVLDESSNINNDTPMKCSTLGNLNNLSGQLVNMASQQSHDQELQLKILQKLQQQTLMSQPRITLSRLPLIQEQQKILLDMQQQLPGFSVAQQRIMPQQDSKVSMQTSPAPSIVKQDLQQKILQKQVTLADISDVAFPLISSTHAVLRAGSSMIVGAA
jgi:hypothetical protein